MPSPRDGANGAEVAPERVLPAVLGWAARGL